MKALKTSLIAFTVLTLVPWSPCQAMWAPFFKAIAGFQSLRQEIRPAYQARHHTRIALFKSLAPKIDLESKEYALEHAIILSAGITNPDVRIKLAQELYNTKKSGRLAPQKYQHIGLAAQITVGIPEENIGVVVSEPTTNDFDDTLAYLMSGDICVTKLLDKKPDIFIKFALLHEATHKKYALKRETLDLFHEEQRADREAAYALQCHECVMTCSKHRKSGTDRASKTLSKDGYLFAEDLQSISQELKTQNKVCDYHKQQQA